MCNGTDGHHCCFFKGQTKAENRGWLGSESSQALQWTGKSTGWNPGRPKPNPDFTRDHPSHLTHPSLSLPICTVEKGVGKIRHKVCKIHFPGGSDGKASVYNARDAGSIPGSGRSTGEGNGNPLQYYCLENPMNRGASLQRVGHD